MIHSAISKVENEKIISQFIGPSKICEPNGDRVSKSLRPNKSGHNCSKRLKGVKVKCEKYGTLSIHEHFRNKMTELK